MGGVFLFSATLSRAIGDVAASTHDMCEPRPNTAAFAYLWTMNPVFTAARDALFALRENYDEAYATFRFPRFEHFNWALEHFDQIDAGQTALIVSDEDGSRRAWTFGDLKAASNRLANRFRRAGLSRGDALMLMLPNVPELWITLLACMKLGVVIVPSSVQLRASDVASRLSRANIKHVVTDAEGEPLFEDATTLLTRWTMGASPRPGFVTLDADAESDVFLAPTKTAASDPLLLYFTSGTTALPKLVLHTHQSYPVGHLSTMYWIGLLRGDVHWNISSPGWAKHAWSNVFAPWNAEAAVFIRNTRRFTPQDAFATLKNEPIRTLCAPPTVWRMLIGERLPERPPTLRECVSAGEPLNPEVIAEVSRVWGITVRDGFGQTETTALVGNTPGQTIVAGSMGRPLPGYGITIGEERAGEIEGELAIAADPPPVGLMVGYAEDMEGRASSEADVLHRTGDICRRDRAGRITYVGRADDVFKSSDYRISPFELESVLIEHPDVVEAAVVPSPDPMRLSVPKAFVALREGVSPSDALGAEILAFVADRVPGFKRIRRLAFAGAEAPLPKTISGKIRRVELRQAEAARDPSAPLPGEVWR